MPRPSGELPSLGWAAALLIALVCAASAADVSFPACAPAEDGGKKLPTFAGLMACQSEARRGFIGDYEKRNGMLPPPRLTDRLDDFQRREAREYASKHPDLATQDFSEDSKPKAEAKGDYAGRIGEFAGAAKKKLEALLQRAKALWTKDAPAPKNAPEAGQAAAEQDQSLDEVAAAASRSGLEASGVFKEVAADPAGALKRAAARKRQNEENLDPAMKGLLK
jgi:hypothetical protein